MEITLISSKDKWVKAGEHIVVYKESEDGKVKEEIARFTMPKWDHPTRYIPQKLEIREYQD